jgi:fructose-1,6-bisphosphatase
MTTIVPTTLTQFVIDEQRATEGTADELSGLISEVGLACKIMSTMVSRWPLTRIVESEQSEATPGEKRADSISEILVRAREWSAHLGHAMWHNADAMFRGVSEYARHGYLLVFEPIDRWANLDINVSVGSMFSISRVPGADETDQAVQPPRGAAQVCAGYAIYGPSTIFVLATEHGVNGFTLDRAVGEFVLTHPNLTIAHEAQDFAINTSSSRFWTAAIKRYVDECVAGRNGPRGRDFNMRWNGSLVTELHRTLMRGGLCCYPRDSEGRNESRCLRLGRDAKPVAYNVEKAGGAASTGAERVLDVEPQSRDQRVTIVFGARLEVELIERYHRESAQGDYTSPLFNARGLFESEIH